MAKRGIDIMDVMRWSQQAERSRREHNSCGDSGVSPQESEQLDLLDPSSDTVAVESVHEPGDV